MVKTGNILRTYVLDGMIPVPESDMLKWGKWKSKNKKRVAESKIVLPDRGSEVCLISISTVFLGIDHSLYEETEPLLFETMVFGDPLDQEQSRCSTYEGAIQMHLEWCEKVKASLKELYG